MSIFNKLKPVKPVNTILLLFVLINSIIAQKANSTYLNTALSTEERVNDLISKLSLSQKIKLLQHPSLAIDSNGIQVPAYNWWNECLHGVARAGKATVFPQAIGLAATWDTSLIYKVADAISDEARAKYTYFSEKGQRGIYQGLNFWSPNINIFRDPRWGRGMETYGEDPYLTGKIATAFIKGLQGNNSNYFKTIATAKHFAVHSGPEATRHQFNALVSDYDLYETYTPAFKMAVQEASVYSIMCAYNRFRDKPCCENDFLLQDLLRNKWGFKGFIVTDCWAVHDMFVKGYHEFFASQEEAVAATIKAGVDLECGNAFSALDIALEKKLISQADLDRALQRLFTARFKLGFFDPDSKNSIPRFPYSCVEGTAHKKLAREAAQKSIVLLKNENKTLPLSKSVKTIAVIGPNANDGEVLLANYHGFPSHCVTPLEGIKKKLPATKVLYAVGAAHAPGLPVLSTILSDYLHTGTDGLQKGLKARYYNNANFSGKAVLTRVDQIVDFNWVDKSPAAKIDPLNFSVNWDGYLKAPDDGEYILDIYGSSEFKMVLDGKELFSFSSEHGPEHRSATVSLQKNKIYKINLQFINTKSSPLLKLKWQLPKQNYEQEALIIAAKAEAVVMVMGLSPRIEGEQLDIQLDGFAEGDRTKLQLPDNQQELIKKITALGKPVILVLVNGSALAINWEQEHVPAIVETWYGGQEAGNAIADVLFGDYNPGGRLPVTFYKSENDIPAFDNYDMQGRTYRYFKGSPLYQFGYGLSYTTFTYSNPVVQSPQITGRPVEVNIYVKNTGDRDGEEVIQVYVQNTTTTGLNPIHALKGFKRIYLKKGEEKKLTFILQASDFSVLTKESKRMLLPGEFIISAGGGQPDDKCIQLKISLTGNPLEIPL